MNVDISMLLGALGTLLGIYFGYQKAKKESIVEAESKTAEITRIRVSSENAEKLVNKIDLKLDNLATEVKRLSEKTVLIEAKADKANERIDTMQ